MRRARLGALLLSVFFAACGSDGGAKPDPNPGDGSGDGDGEVAAGDGEGDGAAAGDGSTGVSDEDIVASCPRADVPSFPSFEGDSGWTEAEYDACGAACPEGSAADCVETSCAPGFEEFGACVNREIDVCLTLPGGACRSQWEELLCCEAAKCGDATSDEAYFACSETQCAGFNEAMGTCGSSMYMACVAPAVPLCFEDATGAANERAALPVARNNPSVVHGRVLERIRALGTLSR